MIRLDPIRCGQGWDEQISEGWRIILPGASARSRADTATAACPDTRSNSASAAGPGTRCPGVTGSFPGGRRRQRRRGYGRRRDDGRLNLWLRVRWLDRRDCKRLRFRHRRRIGPDADELHSLCAGAGAVSSASPTAGRPLATTAEYWIVGEIRRSDHGGKNEKKDHCVHQQRRNDPFPIPILPPR